MNTFDDLTRRLRNLITETDHANLHAEIDAGIGIAAADVIDALTARVVRLETVAAEAITAYESAYGDPA